MPNDCCVIITGEADIAWTLHSAHWALFFVLYFMLIFRFILIHCDAVLQVVVSIKLCVVRRHSCRSLLFTKMLRK